jgi:hypothetical protein
LFWFAIAAVVLSVAFAVYRVARREPRSAVLSPTDQYDETVETGDEDSATFDAVFEKHIVPQVERYFFTRIAGVSFRNSDGGRRPPIIEKCEPMEQLRLEMEPENVADPQAIAVKRIDGSQLGYLERRVADELHRDAGQPFSWSAIFKHANRRPESEEVVGATIVLTRSPVLE